MSNNWRTKENFEKLDTRHLLKLLNIHRADHDKDLKDYIKLGEKIRRQEDMLHILKTVLGTREHIPNKKEAKAIRQAKAKAKKHRE